VIRNPWLESIREDARFKKTLAIVEQQFLVAEKEFERLNVNEKITFWQSGS
jgi:hypothetical protein